MLFSNHGWDTLILYYKHLIWSYFPLIMQLYKKIVIVRKTISFCNGKPSLLFGKYCFFYWSKSKNINNFLCNCATCPVNRQISNKLLCDYTTCPVKRYNINKVPNDCATCPVKIQNVNKLLCDCASCPVKRHWCDRWKDQIDEVYTQ